MIVDKRYPVLITGGERLGTNQRRVDQLLFTVAVYIRPSDMVGRGQRIDFCGLPGHPWIALVPEQPDESLAFGGDHAELVLEGELRDAVTVDVVSRHVDQPIHVSNQHVAFPARVFVPSEFRKTRGETDYVRAPVIVDVGDQNGITTWDFSLDDVRAKSDRFGRVDGSGKRQAHKEQSKAKAHVE